MGAKRVMGIETRHRQPQCIEAILPNLPVKNSTDIVFAIGMCIICLDGACYSRMPSFKMLQIPHLASSVLFDVRVQTCKLNPKPYTLKRQSTAMPL